MDSNKDFTNIKSAEPIGVKKASVTEAIYRHDFMPKEMKNISNKSENDNSKEKNQNRVIIMISYS